MYKPTNGRKAYEIFFHLSVSAAAHQVWSQGKVNRTAVGQVCAQRQGGGAMGAGEPVSGGVGGAQHTDGVLDGMAAHKASARGAQRRKAAEE